MKIKLNYFIIPLVTILASAVGGQITKQGMGWYNSINLPSFTPPGYFIGIVWTIIFILSTISALLVYNSKIKPKSYWQPVMILFLLNAVLNIWWSTLFFGFNRLGLALIELVFLNLTNLALIIILWRRKPTAAWLLLPYFLWVCFAGYLNLLIWQLNR